MIFEHVKAIDQLLQDEDIHIRPSTPERNPSSDEPLVVVQAESDFTIEPVQNSENLDAGNPEPEIPPTNQITVPTGTTQLLGQAQLGFSGPIVSGPRPGSKRKHAMETSTIVLRNGLLIVL